ncbi:MAG TPA: tetratricopeptide repeat protein [Gemmataceae bacterium]|nr:tetratricopeptide repeat protein [Gemmataceae bacterium]
MGAHFERARVLFRQQRYGQAANELREELAQAPHDGQTHSFLGRCLARLNQKSEALAECEEGVRLAPHLPYAHYMLGLTFLDLNQLEKAQAALGEALRLDPRNAEQLEWLSWIQFQRGDKYGALATSEQGLAIDPQHVGCLNRHGYYLRWLGLWRASEEPLRAALKLEPENAYTHTNLGWTLWSKAHALKASLKESLSHFQEALRLDPTSDWAKAGVADILLRRTRRVILPLFVVLVALIILSAAVSAGHGSIGSLMLMFGLFCIASSAGPAYLVMHWTRLGAAVLTPARQRAAKATAACLGGGAAAPLVALMTPPAVALAVLFISLALVGPLTTAFEATPGWPRKLLIGYIALFAGVALVGLAIMVSARPGTPDPDRAALFLTYCLGLGSILSQRIGRNVEKMFAKKGG